MALKNLILLTTTLCLGCSANANATSFSSGFYVGMGAGMERMNGQRSERMNDDQHGFTPQVLSHNQDMKKHGHLIDFFGGYLHRLQNFAIGLEAFFGVGRVSSEINKKWSDDPTGLGILDEWKYKATLEKKNHFGLHGRIGYVAFDRVFVYGLIGFSACQLRYSSDQQIFDTTPALHQSQFSQRKLAYGFDYGLGAEYQSGPYRFGVEGYVANFKRQLFHFPFNKDVYGGSPNIQVSIKPIHTVIKIKLSISF